MEFILFLIVVVLVCLFLTVFGLLVYSGLFASVEIRAGKPPFDALVVAYKFARGPYKNAGGLFTEVASLVPRLKCIGVYYDDPSEVDVTKLRYVVGAVLGEGEASADESQSEDRNLLLKNGFRITKLPAVSYAVNTTFPFKNTLSIFLALGRVYPKLGAYIKERNLCAHPMIEVYDNGMIYFVAPLAKQDEFYVPEAQEDGEDEPQSEGIPTSAGDRVQVQPERSTLETHGSNEPASAQEPQLKAQQQSLQPSSDTTVPSKEGSSNGSGEESTGSSFEELNIDNDK